MLVIVTFGIGVHRTPVHLSDDDRSCINHWHLIVEVGYLGLWVRIAIAAAIPSAVVVNGIADVITLDGVGGIACIVRLPSCAWNPDNASESVGANLFYNGLEIVVQSLRVVLIVGILQIYRFVSQLDAYLTGILLDVGIFDLTQSRLGKVHSYLIDTAEEFESVESELSGV